MRQNRNVYQLLLIRETERQLHALHVGSLSADFHVKCRLWVCDPVYRNGGRETTVTITHTLQHSQLSCIKYSALSG
jgi:hypothetical protein